MNIKTIENADFYSFRDHFNETIYTDVFIGHDEETAEEYADGFYYGCLQAIYQARGGNWPFRLTASEKRDLEWYLTQQSPGVKEGKKWSEKHLSSLADMCY